jgi:hypothetical protein
VEPSEVQHDLAERLMTEYQQLEAGAYCEYEAWQAMTELAQESDPHAAWRIVKEILPRVSDDQIGYLAAGPVEDLIDFHWQELETEMAELARSSARFREALACVQLGPWVPEEVKRRFEEMARS